MQVFWGKNIPGKEQQVQKKGKGVCLAAAEWVTGMEEMKSGRLRVCGGGELNGVGAWDV